ncbi:MAG: hypothetical protein JW767_09960, partial [Thermoleophilia bacterium]|nr:hypothetical protein [Thermoleophilia bacterium]
DGNVIVVGSSHRPATGWDWVVLSYRADGTRRWVQRYDGPSHLDDKPAKMLIDSRDRIYVAGVSRSAVRYDDALLVKYSQSGSRLWAKRFDGSADHADAARSLCARPGGGVYVCGYTSSIGTGVNGLLLAYSGAGSRLFTTVEDRYDASTSTQVFQDVAVRRGGEIVCGGFDQLSGPDTDVLYGFYSPEGSLRWLTHWYSDWNDQLTALARDGQGGVYLTGTYGTASGPQVFTQHLCAGGTDWYCLWPSVPSVGHEPMAIAVNGVNAYVVGSNGAGDRFVVGHVY